MSVKKAIGYGFGGCLGVFFAMVVVGGCIVAVSPAGRDAYRRGKEHAESGKPIDAGVATLSKFNRITPGMTIYQVEGIMGAPGEVITESAFATGTQFATAHAMYSWKADNGIANMNISITNGTVSNKTQIGLR